jgi:hypothetical protein
MTSDARDRITDLYHAALTRAPEDRAAFLNDACQGDDALRREVGSLLGYNEAAAPSDRRMDHRVAAIRIARRGEMIAAASRHAGGNSSRHEDVVAGDAPDSCSGSR